MPVTAEHPHTGPHTRPCAEPHVGMNAGMNAGTSTKPGTEASAETSAKTNTGMHAKAATASRTLVRNVHAPFAARRLTRTQLLSWGLPGLVDALEVIVDELTANAFEHGTGPFLSVRLERRGDTVTAQVWDECGTRLPEAAPADVTDEHGRGLLLVEALSDRWGTYRSTRGGKVTWATCS